MKKGLCELCSPKQWKTVSSGMLLNDGYPVYGANGVIGFYSEYNHDKKTLLITCRGATCGSLNICEPYSYVNGNAMALDELSEEIDIDYLFYFLLHRGFDDIITGSAQPQIVRESLKKVSIEYPDLVSQKRIAENIKKVGKITALRKKQLQKLDDLVKARFVEMFEQGMYEETEFGGICEFLRNGANIKQTKGAAGIPITRIETLANDVFNIDRLGYADIFELGKYEAYRLQAGDILMSHINSVVYLGRAVQYKGQLGDAPIIHGMNLLCARIMHSFNPTFVEYFFKTPAAKKYISSITKKAVNQASITTTDLKKMKIPAPPIEEQEQFAAFVSQVDKSKLSIQQSLEKLETLKQSLMQQYFG